MELEKVWKSDIGNIGHVWPCWRRPDGVFIPTKPFTYTVLKRNPPGCVQPQVSTTGITNPSHEKLWENTNAIQAAMKCESWCVPYKAFIWICFFLYNIFSHKDIIFLLLFMLFYFLNAGDRGMGRMPQLIALACCLMYLSMFAHASISCNCLFADTCVPRVCVCTRAYWRDSQEPNF